MKSKFSSVLPRGQLRLGPVALEAASLPVGDLVAGQRGEQARRRPTFPVRVVVLRQRRHLRADGRQALRRRQEPLAQNLRVGKFPGIEAPLDLRGQLRFAASVVGQSEQVHRPAAGPAVVRTLAQRVKARRYASRGNRPSRWTQFSSAIGLRRSDGSTCR